jgi:hypothetical protein
MLKLAPAPGEIEQRQESGGGRQALLDDLGAGQPGDLVGVIAWMPSPDC